MLILQEEGTTKKSAGCEGRAEREEEEAKKGNQGLEHMPSARNLEDSNHTPHEEVAPARPAALHDK